MPPVALLASAGRGYLPPLGWAILTVFLAQILAAIGWGAWFPWSVPALFSGLAGPRATRSVCRATSWWRDLRRWACGHLRLVAAARTRRAERAASSGLEVPTAPKSLAEYHILAYTRSGRVIGRGYLARPWGGRSSPLFVAQIAAVTGWGPWIPWPGSALSSGLAGPRADQLGPHSYAAVALACAAGLAGTFGWWLRADQTR